VFGHKRAAHQQSPLGERVTEQLKKGIKIRFTLKGMIRKVARRTLLKTMTPPEP
jgi:hypothetical protein